MVLSYSERKLVEGLVRAQDFNGSDNVIYCNDKLDPPTRSLINIIGTDYLISLIIHIFSTVTLNSKFILPFKFLPYILNSN